jgi:hypothetical protein
LIGLVRQADLSIAVLRAVVRFCRESREMKRLRLCTAVLKQAVRSERS